MGVGDLADEGKAEAVALDISRACAAVEALEHLLAVFRRDAGSTVADGEDIRRSST